MATERSTRRLRGNTIVGLAAAMAVVLAACSTGAGAGSSPAATGSAAPTSIVPTAEATVAGLTAYADWIARQGFGGSSGLNNVRKLARWLTENRTSATPYDLAADQHDIQNLISWLETHPATPCWTGERQALLDALTALAAGYDQAIAARAAGEIVPDDVASAIFSAADAAFDQPAPTACP